MEDIEENQNEDFNRSKRLYDWYPLDSMEAMLVGVAAVHPSLYVDIITKTVFLNRYRRNRVGLITGSGAGHEPFAFGFLGESMLTAAVIGDTFASPPSQSIFCAIKNVAQMNKGGVLAIILNYSGIVLNFGIAVEECQARGMTVECVVIGDDLVGTDWDVKSVSGKRGSAGIIFAIKIAGALSTNCHSLAEITLTMHAVNARLVTIGTCLSPCSPPNQHPMFTVAPNEVHVGVGLHGEAGGEVKELMSAAELIALLVDKIKKDPILKEGDDICVLLNDLGGLSYMETNVLAAEAYNQLINCGFNIVRMYADRLLTSLDTNGFQLCVLNVTGKEEWIPLLDANTEAVFWPKSCFSYSTYGGPKTCITSYDQGDMMEHPPHNSIVLDEAGANAMKECLRSACNAVIAEEKKINSLDTDCGDTGSIYRGFCKYVLSKINHLTFHNVGQLFIELSMAAESEMHGLLGGVHFLLFLGAARNSNDWAGLFNGSIELLNQYTPVKLGEKTQFDALIPASNTFTRVMADKGSGEWRLALKGAVEKAARGCDATRDMEPSKLKSKWVYPTYGVSNVDPGAYAVVIWLASIYRVLLQTFPPLPPKREEQIMQSTISVNVKEKKVRKK